MLNNKDKNKQNTNDELTTTVDEIETLSIEQAPMELEETYKPVNQLFIPQEAKDAYEAAGWDLQWIRMHIPNSNGAIDYKNIQVKEGSHYQMVPRNEVPGLNTAMSSYFKEELSDSSHGLYVVGDCVLAKLPKVRQEAKRKYLEAKTHSRSKAIIDDLRKNKLMPDANSGEKIEIVRQQPKANMDFGE